MSGGGARATRHRHRAAMTESLWNSCHLNSRSWGKPTTSSPHDKGTKQQALWIFNSWNSPRCWCFLLWICPHVNDRLHGGHDGTGIFSKQMYTDTFTPQPSCVSPPAAILCFHAVSLTNAMEWRKMRDEDTGFQWRRTCYYVGAVSRCQ